MGERLSAFHRQTLALNKFLLVLGLIGRKEKYLKESYEQDSTVFFNEKNQI